MAWCASEVLKTTLRHYDLLAVFIESAYSGGYDLLQQKDKEQNYHRGEVHGVKTRRNQAEASKSPFPVESQGTCLIPAAVSCDNT